VYLVGKELHFLFMLLLVHKTFGGLVTVNNIPLIYRQNVSLKRYRKRSFKKLNLSIKEFSEVTTRVLRAPNALAFQIYHSLLLLLRVLWMSITPFLAISSFLNHR
jgi:hypothetical protein